MSLYLSIGSPFLFRYGTGAWKIQRIPIFLVMPENASRGGGISISSVGAIGYPDE
jgi:hypothetical protein